MANWLERARQQIPLSAGRPTAKTDDRKLSAVTAVPKLSEFGNATASIGSNGSAPVEDSLDIAADSSMTAAQESAIRSWLAQIDEADGAIIAHVLNRCQCDPDARGYFIRLASDASRPAPFPNDRRRCDQCVNLTERGLCLAARRGEIVANRDYEPARELLRRCEGYQPGADDPDRRRGRERWPELIQKGEK